VALGIPGPLLLSIANAAAAQTDFYNTSIGRPLTIEDATPAEFRALELDIAPLRFESVGRGRQWSLHPETTIGILPRTQLQIAAPLAYIDGIGSSTRGLAGLEVSALHAFNTETSIPALAIAGDLLLPVGPLGGESTYGSVKGILTKTTTWARIHVNAQYTFGPAAGANGAAAQTLDAREVSWWLAGLAIDKTFPLRSLLVSAESFADKPVAPNADVAWNAGVGVRYQLTPRWATDAGGGRRFTGNDRAWYVTFGTAYALGF
jgi:hypothetical protein